MHFVNFKLMKATEIEIPRAAVCTNEPYSIFDNVFKNIKSSYQDIIASMASVH